MKIYNRSDIDKPTNITIQRFYGLLESNLSSEARSEIPADKSEIPLKIKKANLQQFAFFPESNVFEIYSVFNPSNFLEDQATELEFSYPRTDTKNFERAIYAEAQKYYERLFISYNSIELDYVKNDRRNEIQAEYEPSEDLVTIVCLSYQKRMVERDQFAKFGMKSGLQFENVKLENYEESSGQYNWDLYKAMRIKITEEIKGFIASLGRTLLKGESFKLSENGKVLDLFLEGFVYRLMVTIDDAQSFGRYLYKDLFRAAQFNLLQSDFAKLILVNGDLVVEGVKEPADVPRRRNSQKAEIIYPEF